MSRQRIVPNIWCDGNAEEVVAFYRSVFSESAEISRTHYPNEGLAEFQAAMAGQVLTIEFRIADLRFIAINAGPEFRPNPMLSFMVNIDPAVDPGATERIDELWTRLSEQGQVLMGLDSYPFSPRYGWVQDRFGVSWQLMLRDPAGELRPLLVPALMFANDQVNRAEEAARFYVSLFDDAQLGTLARYAEDQGEARAGALMYGDFSVGDQWFAVMDSPIRHNFDFTEAVSLMVECDDQAEIDRLWAALSSVPEAEACGWCKDRFGVSWQVVPADMEAFMSPRNYAAVMGMTKIVLADLAR